MAWVRVDDNLHAHPKFRAAWESDPAAGSIWIAALTWSAAYLRDGAVDDLFLRAWFRSRTRQAHVVDALVDAVLWEPNGAGGWQIHDWADYNPTRAQTEERRRLDAARKRGARRVSS